MSQRLSDIQQELLGTFFEEATEALGQLESGLLVLANSEDSDDEIINDVFRAAHSIKGGAATFGLVAIAELSHAAETLLDRLRSRQVPHTPAVISTLLESVDALQKLLQNARNGVTGPDPRYNTLKARLETNSVPTVPPPAPKAANAAQDAKNAKSAKPAHWSIEFLPKPEMLETGNDAVLLLREVARQGTLTVTPDVSKVPPLAQLVPTQCYLGFHLDLLGSVSRATIDDVFAWVEGEADVIVAEITDHDHAQPAAKGPAMPDAPAARVQDASHDREVNSSSIRVSVNKLDMLMNMVGELVITQSILGELEGEGPIDAKRLASLRDGLSLLARNTRALQESVMKLRSMPIGSVLARLPRLVHDLSQQLGKRVELKLNGQTTEVDKTVLEKLGDPLTHLVRNSLDHGIETPDIRRAKGKPEHGTLAVRAFHRGGDIVVEIQDDGAGLNLPKILARGRVLGLVAENETPSDEAIRDLIFAPGFSTADNVSDVSGRGVGMDVVRRNITSIGGQIHLTSVTGQGTRTELRLPLTLAIIDGQLVAVGQHTYVIPLLSILESVEIDAARVSRFEGHTEIYRLRDELVPMVELRALLGLGSETRSSTQRLLVVVEAEGERIGLLVDELLAQQQVVVKSLETNYGHVEGLGGATILGDGGVALILDVVGLARLAKRTRAAAARFLAA
jgi:two-component system chemotaxis sensor kinase CheA